VFVIETRAELRLEPGSILTKSYGTLRVLEGYRCNYGPNPQFEDVVFTGDLWVTARDLDGEVRAAELHNHPFFVGTLFHPERRALEDELPPLVREFSKAILANGRANNEAGSLSI
jgi:CTP synthase (UTP-ammonia lyase)